MNILVAGKPQAWCDAVAADIERNAPGRHNVTASASFAFSGRHADLALVRYGSDKNTVDITVRTRLEWDGLLLYID